MGNFKTASLRRLAILGVFGVLMSRSIVQVSADTNVEEQKPIADPAVDAFDDSVWTSSPLYEHALSLMKESPLIDTHIDLPQVIRSLGKSSAMSTYLGYPRVLRPHQLQLSSPK